MSQELTDLPQPLPCEYCATKTKQRHNILDRPICDDCLRLKHELETEPRSVETFTLLSTLAPGSEIKKGSEQGGGVEYIDGIGRLVATACIRDDQMWSVELLSVVGGVINPLIGGNRVTLTNPPSANELWKIFGLIPTTDMASLDDALDEYRIARDSYDKLSFRTIY